MAGATRTVRIRFTGDAKGLIVSSAAAETALDRVQDKVTKGFPKVVTGLAKFANAVAGAFTALNLLAGAGAGIAVATGALLALPAAGLAAVGVLAAIKLGADGAKKAFANLAVSVDPLKAKVSAAFERGLKPAVDSLNKTLPKLGGGLAGIATQLSGVATAGARTVALPRNVKTLNGVLTSTSGLLAGVKRAVGPLIQAFLDIVSVGTSGFTALGDRIANAAQRFSNLVATAKNNGSLAAWMHNAFEALHQFWQTLKDVGAIVAAVFGGLADGAGGLGQAFSPLIKAVREFVESAPGQAFLRTIGAAMAAIGQAVASVVMPALRALAPLVGPLATLFAAVTTAVAGLIVPLIQFLAPVLERLAVFIQANIGWLGPLATAIGVVVAAVWLFNAALNANPIMLVVTLIAILVAAFVGLWEKSAAFRDFFITVWNAIKSAVGAVVDWITDKWNRLISFFQGMPSFFSRIGQGIADGITSGFKNAVNFLIGLLNGLIDGVNWIIHGLNVVNPFGDIPDIPHVPRLARGGTLTQGGLAMVGERGRELVSLPAGAQVSSHRDTEAMLGGGGQPPSVRVYIGDRELRDLVRVEVDETNRAVHRAVFAGAGGSR